MEHHYDHESDSGDDDSMTECADMEMTGSLGVTFAACDQVREIPSREDYTPEEIRAAHYCKEDFKGMKLEASETIRLHFAGELSATEHCMRGLECRTNAGFSAVKNNRLQASFAVIDEQDRQDEIGINDLNLIAEVYQKKTVACRYHAYAQGFVDAQEVIKEILSSLPPGTQAPLSFICGDEKALEQDVLAWVLSNTTADASMETGFPLYDKEVEPPQVDSMEWIAEAA